MCLDVGEASGAWQVPMHLSYPWRPCNKRMALCKWLGTPSPLFLVWETWSEGRPMRLETWLCIWLWWSIEQPAFEVLMPRWLGTQHKIWPIRYGILQCSDRVKQIACSKLRRSRHHNSTWILSRDQVGNEFRYREISWGVEQDWELLLHVVHVDLKSTWLVGGWHTWCPAE